MVDTASIAVFDRALLKQKRLRSAPRFAEFNFLHEWAETQILDRLDVVTKDFPLGLHIGRNVNENFLNALKQQSGAQHIWRFDQTGHGDVMGEEDFFPFKPESLDLITSTLNLHSVNDLPGALLQFKQALKEDGLFVAVLFGGETLYELCESLMHAEMQIKGGLSPRIFPFADKQQAGALLQRAGFALPVVDSEIITVTYENMFKLMHDLRGMGESNVIAERSRLNPGKEFFFKAAEYYQQNFAESDGRIKASFEVIFLLGWAPHESQQKPLKPGSAKTRLADALQTDEIKTGEMPS